MQLPPHIIDLVGTLLDEGWSDEEICNAVVRAMKADHRPRISASFGRRFWVAEPQCVEIGPKQSA